jgi:hypothetical protein
MTNKNCFEMSQRSWLTSKIGWLSLCMVAVAWGDRLLPSDDWANIWGIVGVFGLASALGLASIAASRQRAAERG